MTRLLTTKCLKGVESFSVVGSQAIIWFGSSVGIKKSVNEIVI